MASKRAQRRRVCGRKRRYADRPAAAAAIAELHHRRGYQGLLTPYRCRFCGGWHYGHPPAPVRRAMGR